MFRSIRTTLLFWYGLVFLLLIGAFGTTVYLRISRSIFRTVDTKLEAYGNTLAAGLVEMDDGSIDLEVPKSFRNLFRRGEDLPYYLIWDKSGKIIHRSAAAKDAPHPGKETRRSRGSSREFSVPGPKGTTILVGSRATEELKSLREFLAAVLFAGGVVTIVALGGGWFLTSRALSPIRRISEAASTITASDLTRRIDVAQTESELGRLARTLNEAFDRLETTFKQQTRFTADASHELRTPLSLVLSQAELALMKERSPEEYREALRAVERAALRMKAVVEGLLTLARADAKQLPLAKEPVALAPLVEETAGLLSPLASQRKVAVAVHARPAGVVGDKERLRDAVSNLLSNAIRYTPEGGKVDVTLAAEGSEAVLRVADTGIGIPEKDRPHIFERFYRVDEARARDKGGSGLGLAITKWVLEAHGGTISFDSREGQGTTFTVRLPLSPAP